MTDERRAELAAKMRAYNVEHNHRRPQNQPGRTSRRFSYLLAMTPEQRETYRFLRRDKNMRRAEVLQLMGVPFDG